MKLKTKRAELEICTDMIGSPSIILGVYKVHVAFHLLPDTLPYWGYAEEWYDGPFWTFGFGRFLQVVIDEGRRM